MNGLYSPIKRQRLPDYLTKHAPTIHYLQETHLRFKDKNTLEVNNEKKISHSKGNHKKAGVATLVLDKTNYQKPQKNVDKEIKKDIL